MKTQDRDFHQLVNYRKPVDKNPFVGIRNAFIVTQEKYK